MHLLDVAGPAFDHDLAAELGNLRAVYEETAVVPAGLFPAKHVPMRAARRQYCASHSQFVPADDAVPCDAIAPWGDRDANIRSFVQQAQQLSQTVEAFINCIGQKLQEWAHV